MKSSELYDAITKIDDKLIERADRARLHPASDTQGNRSSGNELPVNGKIGAGRLAAVSGTVLAAVFVMAVILAFVGIGENNGNRVTAEKTQTGGSSTVYYSLNGKYVLSASISSPQTVKNNGSFKLVCSFGIESDDVANGIDTFSVSVANRIYETDAQTGLEKSDAITFFDKNGDYLSNVSAGRLQMTGKDELPFRLEVPAEVHALEAGAKGVIAAEIYAIEEKGKILGGNVVALYYYCSGDHIGFGANEAEAYANAFAGK
jgi:hypothetical protein